MNSIKKYVSCCYSLSPLIYNWYASGLSFLKPSSDQYNERKLQQCEVVTSRTSEVISMRSQKIYLIKPPSAVLDCMDVAITLQLVRKQQRPRTKTWHISGLFEE